MATTEEHSLVIGVFRDHASAAQAIDELHSAGFRDDKVRLKHAATASGLLDGPANRLIGLEAESKTLPEELVDKGMSQDEANYYEQEFEAGHSIVIVESHGDQQEARDILQRYGAYDAGRTGTSHSPYDAGRTGTSHSPYETSRSPYEASHSSYDASRTGASHNPYDAGHSPYGQIGDDLTISLREEVLLAHKQSVQIDEVVFRKEVITEEKTITVPVRREELIIEHLPTPAQPSDQPQQEDQLGKDRSDDPEAQGRRKAPDKGQPCPPLREDQRIEEALKNGETLKIVLREEQVRVETYPVIKEEVLISKQQIEETKHFSDTLKREEVHVERVGNVPIQENDGNTA